MKLRLALKICHALSSDPFTMRPNWTGCQIDQARHIGRKKWRDNRFPYVDSEEELTQRADSLSSMICGLMVKIADEKGIEVPPEIRDDAFDFSFLKG